MKPEEQELLEAHLERAIARMEQISKINQHAKWKAIALSGIWIGVGICSLSGGGAPMSYIAFWAAIASFLVSYNF